MKPKQWSVQVVAGLIVLGGIVQAEILPPTDDTSGTLTYNTAKPPVVTKRSLTSLNGTGTTLPVSKTRTAFVRFAVEETGMMAGTVEKARLTLYFPSVTKVGDLSLHVVTQDWEEIFTGPTRLQPAMGASFLTIPSASVIKKQFVIVDVTQQVKDWLTTPGSNYGIAVTSPDGLANVTIGSKEGSASGYPPLLEIEGTGATSANTANAIVKRDGDGNFMVGTITGALMGNATSATTAGSATDFTGVLAGDVTGTQGATVVSAVGGVSAANVASGANLANAATTVNTPNTIVKRDASGNIPGSPVAAAPPGMVLIPVGAFTMGNSIAADTDVTNAAPVSTTVSAYYMDVNEVTLSQWQAVYFWAKDNGYTDLPAGSGKGPNHPVHTVSWYDCVKWCNARSEQEAKTPVYYTNDAQTTIYKTGGVDVSNAQVKWSANGYRLPTEAEWEKAARGGVAGKRFPWGNTITQNLANYSGNTGYSYDLGPNGFNAVGSIGGTSPATSPVGSFALNGYGLNDMVGNIYEWCWDWYGAPYSGGSDPKGTATGSARVIRGSSWQSHAGHARCADRGSNPPVPARDYIGFRAVLPPGQP
jgi:formylglycine-generating enzyme required for sulfatase activity